MLPSKNALLVTAMGLTLSYSVCAKELKPKEVPSYFPGYVELIPLDEKAKYPSLPKDAQEDLARIADAIWTPAQACELYNTFTKTMYLHWCLPDDYNPNADRSATRYNLTHHDVHFYNADDSLELAVSVYAIKPLSMLQVEVQNSFGTITHNAAYPHDAILEDPHYQALLTASIETSYSKNPKDSREAKRTKAFSKKKSTDWQNYTYTLPFPLPGSDFYSVTLRIVPLEELQGQCSVNPVFQGFTCYLPTDGSYQALSSSSYMAATVVIKPDIKEETSPENTLWKINPTSSPWDKTETPAPAFNRW